MVNDKERQLYQIADILQVPLHHIDKGFKAVETRELDVAPWKVPVTMRVKTDVVNAEYSAVWVHISVNLWLYIVSYDKGQKAKIILVDGARAKLSKGLLQTPCESHNDIKAALARLREAGGMAYAYDNGWQPSTVDLT